MDYETKPTSRSELRKYASLLRKSFDVPDIGPFPVLEVLDKMPEVFENSCYQIVEDENFPLQKVA